MHTFKTFISGSTVLAYMVIGSGHFLDQSRLPNGRRDTIAFAATIPRKVYMYSVVPGGVNTPEELMAARRSDPVVAAHFADFGTHTRLTTLKEDMYVYVSYRKGDKVYYTKKKHKVCKGEVVITDGKNYARTRCANRLSKIFRPPALAFDEPTPPQFDYIDPPSTPDAVPGDALLASNYYGLPDASNYAPPALQAQTGANPGPPSPGTGFSGGPFDAGVPVLLPFGGATPAFFIPPAAPTTPVTPVNPVTPVTPVVVPEPAEWPFLAGALAGLLFLRNKIRKAA